MTPFLLALAAIAAPAAADEEARFRQCTNFIESAPDKAVEYANEWHLRGERIYSRQCLGLAFSALQRWAPAATAFEQAARDAEAKQDPRRADFWVQSGNAWLASGDGAKAKRAFEAALATTALTPELRGEAHLDRAQASVLLGDVAGARTDIDQGLKLVPKDPFGWYLSSALAMREKNLARAKADIAKALELAPDAAELLLHAGNVAGLGGEAEAAKNFYAQAMKSAPGSPSAKAAEAAIAANAAIPAQPK